MIDWTKPDSDGNIHVPDFMDKLINSIAHQVNVHTISGVTTQNEMICNIAFAAQKFFVETIKQQLLKQVTVGTYPNGYPFEGVSKSTILGLGALMNGNISVENEHHSLDGSPLLIFAFEKIAEIADKIKPNPQNEMDLEEIKNLSAGEPSYNALISIKDIACRVVDTGYYDSGDIAIIDLCQSVISKF